MVALREGTSDRTEADALATDGVLGLQMLSFADLGQSDPFPPR